MRAQAIKKKTITKHQNEIHDSLRCVFTHRITKCKHVQRDRCKRACVRRQPNRLEGFGALSKSGTASGGDGTARLHSLTVTCNKGPASA